MADHDRRQGGGGYNSKKRRYRGKYPPIPPCVNDLARSSLTNLPTSTHSPLAPVLTPLLLHHVDDEDHYGPQREHRGPHRRRNELPVPVRLRKQLVDIADSPLRGITEEIHGLAKLVADNYDDLRLRETFVDLALQLVVEQPLKTPFIAAVVLVLNTLTWTPGAAANGGEDGGDTKMADETQEVEQQQQQAKEPQPTSSVVDDLLAKTAVALGENVKAGEWRTVKLYLKLLACLQSCLDGDGVFPILDALFDRAVELQTASSEDVSYPTLRSEGMTTDHVEL